MYGEFDHADRGANSAFQPLGDFLIQHFRMDFGELKGILQSQEGTLMFNRTFDGKYIYNGLLKRYILSPKLTSQAAGVATSPANANKSLVKQLEDDYHLRCVPDVPMVFGGDHGTWPIEVHFVRWHAFA